MPKIKNFQNSGLLLSFRRPRKSEWYYLLFTIIFLVIVVPFEPYDWAQRAVTATVNAKDYRGDAVIIAIDDATQRNLASKSWSERDLAALISKIGSAKPTQIVIDRQFFQFDTPSETEELAKALAGLQQPAAWVIELSPKDAAAISSSGAKAGDEAFAQTSPQIPSAISGLVVPAVMTFQSYAFGAPTYAPTALRTDEGLIPSAAGILAGTAADQSVDIIDIDVSLDPATVPLYSAGDVLGGTVNPSEFANKGVVVSFTGRVGRDTAVTPNNPYTSRAALTIMAADSVRSGPSLSLGWVPAFMVSLLAGIAWLVLRPPYGRIVAISTLLAVALSPLVLEQFLIFQQTSQGVFLLLMLAVGKVWQRVRSLVQEYRTASETKSQFLAQASHDLRQPIHAIGLLADRLGETALSTEQTELVSKISWSVDNASRMFRALLDIAAIESGALKAEIAPVSITDLFAELDSQNALAAEMQNVDLRLVPCSAVVQSDRALLATMLQNLVSNAIRYSPGKKVLVGCRRRGNSATLIVIDNGRGISPSDLEHVQKEFFRSSRRSDLRSDNKGLGLAIVNRLAAMLGLQFALRSEQGRGTAASIDNLKLIDARAEVKIPPPHLRLPLADVKVFVVEDDAETLISTQRLLEGWGCIVETSQSPPHKLPQCDILLSDFDFGNGETLAHRGELLRQLKKSATNVVVISGHHPDQIEEDLPGLRALVLSKPLRAAELRSALMAARLG